MTEGARLAPLGEGAHRVVTPVTLVTRRAARISPEPSMGLTPSMLVAYEHHVRFDGQPSCPVLKVPRRPTLASQLTAVADVYDAICTARPYRPALSRKAALDVLRTRAGTFHDPFLVGNFCRLIADA